MIWEVFKFETLSNLRDRRTIMSAFLFGPLMGPLMFSSLISTVCTPVFSACAKRSLMRPRAWRAALRPRPGTG